MNARVGVLSCISLCGPDLRGQLAAEEIANGASDFLMVGFQSEVAGVVETHLGARVVALERLSTRGQKERIALAPDRQQRRLLGAEIFLELGIERDIAGIIQKQVKLDLVIAGPGQERGVEFVSFRRQQRHILDARRYWALVASGLRKSHNAARFSGVGSF